MHQGNDNDLLDFRFAMVTDMCIKEEGTAKGYIIVADMKGVVFGHMAKLGIVTLKKFMLYLQVSQMTI